MKKEKLKRKEKTVHWLFDLDTNMMNCLNLFGLTITTYGVLYSLPDSGIKNLLKITAIGFFISAIFQFIPFFYDTLNKNKN